MSLESRHRCSDYRSGPDGYHKCLGVWLLARPVARPLGVAVGGRRSTGRRRSDGVAGVAAPRRRHASPRLWVHRMLLRRAGDTLRTSRHCLAGIFAADDQPGKRCRPCRRSRKAQAAAARRLPGRHAAVPKWNSRHSLRIPGGLGQALRHRVPVAERDRGHHRHWHAYRQGLSEQHRDQAV